MLQSYWNQAFFFSVEELFWAMENFLKFGLLHWRRNFFQDLLVWLFWRRKRKKKLKWRRKISMEKKIYEQILHGEEKVEKNGEKKKACSYFSFGWLVLVLILGKFYENLKKKIWKVSTKNLNFHNFGPVELFLGKFCPVRTGPYRAPEKSRSGPVRTDQPNLPGPDRSGNFCCWKNGKKLVRKIGNKEKRNIEHFC